MASCAAQQPGPVSALHYFKQGNAALRAEDHARAIHLYRQALTLDEGSPEIHYNLGVALQQAGAHREAVAAYLNSLALRPQQPEAHFNLALAYDRLFNMAAAHQHYNTYRRLTVAPGGRTAAASTQAPATANRPPARRRAVANRLSGNPQPAGRSPLQASTRQAGVPRAKVSARAALPTVQSRRRSQSTSKRPTPDSDSFLGGTQKWWTEDQFIPKP